ncbi:FAD-dependent thymidylate synthase [Thermoleptolyngbya sp.]
MDKYFRVELLEQTPNPQRLIWRSAHQCVCEGPAIDDPAPDEEKAGEYAVKHLLAGDRGHWSPFEAPQISLNVIGFNHRTMQQITRHRIGVHFSVQSLRYTSVRFCEFAQNPTAEVLESLVYFRPVGEYRDRQGKRYTYTEGDRQADIELATQMLQHYARKIDAGYSEEHAAGLLPMDTRQHWVMSFNVRSLCHLLDLRSKADAQLEIRQLCELVWPHFEAWVPAIAHWYKTTRYGKAKLSP